MQAIVSRPGVVGSWTPKCDCRRSKIASLSFGITPTEPMPCTFEWPRMGIKPAASPADHSAKQGEVGDCLHVFDAVSMVRDPHCPAEDGVLGRGVAGGDRIDLFPSDAALGHDFIPRHFGQPRFQLGPTLTVVAQERVVVRVHVDDAFGDTGEQCEIAADVRLNVQARDIAAEEQAFDIAGNAKPDEACFHEGVDDDHLTAASANVQQRPHQPRVVAGRVAANKEHAVGVLQILKLDRSGPAARDAGEADAARLVAIVTAIVDVVRAVQAGKKLKQEASLVAAAAAEVPESLIGRRRAELRDDAAQSIVPRDRRVTTRLTRVDNRLNKSTACFELAWRKLLQLARRILSARSRYEWRPAYRRPSLVGSFCKPRGSGQAR